MNFLSLIRSKLQQEKDIQSSVQISGNLINFMDNTLQSFLTTEVLDQCASPKIIFEFFIKNFIDQSILENKNPVIFVQGPHGSGKTHLIEGLINQPSQRGQLFQILSYLKENKAENIKIASFLGSYSSLYSLNQFSSQQFKNYTVSTGNKFQVSFSPNIFTLIDTPDELAFFIKQTRANAKTYQKELAGLETLLHKIYLFEYTIENQIGKFMIVDSTLFEQCDSKLRNLLTRYIQGVETLRKKECIQSPLRLQKQVNDIVLEKKKLLNDQKTHSKPNKAKSNISIRESKMLSPFRDFFEENGVFTILTTLSPIQTYYELKRDSEWFGICYKPTSEIKLEDLKNTNTYNTLKSHYVITNYPQQENLAQTSTQNTEKHVNFEQSNFQQTTNYAPYPEEPLAEPLDLTRNALNTTSQFQPTYDEPEQIPLLLNSQLNNSGVQNAETFDFTPLKSGIMNKLDNNLQNLQKSAKAAEQHPVSKKVIIEQKIEKYVEDKVDEYMKTISNLTQTLNQKQNELYSVSKENQKLNEQLSSAFELQDYLKTNGLKYNSKQPEQGVSDRQVFLEQENGNISFQLQQAESQLTEIQLENQKLSSKVKQMEQLEHQLEIIQIENVKLNQQIIEQKDIQLTQSSVQQHQTNELAQLSARNQVLEEKIADLKHQNLQLNQVNAKYENQYSLCKVQESAMYEMEMEIQDLKQKLNDRETDIQTLNFEIQRKETKHRLAYSQVEDL